MNLHIISVNINKQHNANIVTITSPKVTIMTLIVITILIIKAPFIGAFFIDINWIKKKINE